MVSELFDNLSNWSLTRKPLNLDVEIIQSLN